MALLFWQVCKDLCHVNHALEESNEDTAAFCSELEPSKSRTVFVVAVDSTLCC